MPSTLNCIATGNPFTYALPQKISFIVLNFPAALPPGTQAKVWGHPALFAYIAGNQRN